MKVISIIMIIGGAIGAFIMLLVGIFGGMINSAANSVSTEMNAATSTSVGNALAVMWVAIIFGVIGSAIEIFAGIVGVNNWTNPAKAQFMIILGAVITCIQIISIIISIVADSFNAFSIVTGLALPVLYIVGAIQLKNQA